MTRRTTTAALFFAFFQILPPHAKAATYRDDFNYNYDFSGPIAFDPSATSGLGIWSGVANASAGGANTAANSATGRLTMGMSGAGWENENDSGPYLWRNVDVASFKSITARITSQTQGNWSQAGVIVRMPNPIDGVIGQENWYAAWSFRPAESGFLSVQRNRVLNGTENEALDIVGSVTNLEYLRIENLGVQTINFGGSIGSVSGRRFRVLSSGDGVNWTAHPNMSLSGNASPYLINGTVQVGIAVGTLITFPGATTQFDWVQIESTPEPTSAILALFAFGVGTMTARRRRP